MLYPQQNEIRNMLDLSGFWDFQLDPDETGEQQGWYNGLAAARTSAVPGSWNEQFEDAYNYFGTAWYTRHFYVPSAWQGQRIMLRAGSANYAAKVWVNSEQVGNHVGGHLPFEFDITERVRWGSPNLVAIQVDSRLTPTRVPPGNVPRGFFGSHPAANFDFFPYCGIQRPVILYSTPARHITDVRVETTTDGTVKLKVEVSDGATTGQAQLLGEGQPVTAPLNFAQGSAEATLSVPSPRLWSQDDPYLYTLSLTLGEDGQAVDRYTLPVGIRSVEVRGDHILINGKRVFLKGFGRHEDFYVSGRGLNMPLIIKDYSLLKWIGANSYRTSHYPYSEEEMQMADRAGILIIDETPAVGLSFTDSAENIAMRLEQAKQQTRELIARDKNHPSVIMWSIANEPFPPRDFGNMMEAQATDPVNPVSTDFLKQLVDLAHELDSTRPATLVAVHGTPNEWLALGDVICLNRYYGWYTQSGQIKEGLAMLAREFDTAHETHSKPIIVTEFGADTLAGDHRIPPTMWSEEYQAELITGYLDIAAQRDFVAGMHIWNFADFQTGQSIMRAGSMNHKGVFTRTREPKMAAHVLRARWNKQE